MRFRINSQEEKWITFNRLKDMKKIVEMGRNMPRKNINLTPSTVKKLEKMGTQIKRARLRRNISVEVIADQAGISETTFYAIEKGASTVSIGAYATVLVVLELDNDLELIALDEDGKKQFREQNLQRRERATRKKEKDHDTNIV